MEPKSEQEPVESAEAIPEQDPLLPPAVERWLREHAAEMGICLFLVVAALAVYGRTIGYDFVSYDDNEYVYENRHVRDGLTREAIGWAFTHIHASNWHPLTTLSHELDCSLFGLWAGGHHLTNLLLHAASSLVLFLALRRLTGTVWRSGIVAALFCLHPLHVRVGGRSLGTQGRFERIVLRPDVVGLRGLCAEPLSPWPSPGERGKTYLGQVSGGCCELFAGLGLLCKPMLVTLPFVLLLLDYWPLDRGAGSRERGSPRVSWTWLLVEKIPLFVLSAVSCGVTYRVQLIAGAVHEARSRLFACKLQFSHTFAIWD